MKKLLSFVISCSIIFTINTRAVLTKDDSLNTLPIERFLNKIKILKSFALNEKEMAFLTFFEDHTIPLISVARNTNSIINDEYFENENIFATKAAIIAETASEVHNVHEIISELISKMTSDMNDLHVLKNMQIRYSHKDPFIPPSQVADFHKELEQFIYVLNLCFQKLVKAFEGYKSENNTTTKNEKLSELKIFSEFLEIHECKIYESYKKFLNLRSNYLHSENKISSVYYFLQKESAYAEFAPIMIKEYGEILSFLVSESQKESKKYKNMKDELENLFDSNNEILAQKIQTHLTRLELLIEISYVLEFNILKIQKFINSFLNYLNQEIVISTNSYAEKIFDEGVNSAIIAATNFIGIFFNMRRKCKEIINGSSQTGFPSKILAFVSNLNNVLEKIIIKEFFRDINDLPVLGFCFDELLKIMINYFKSKTDKESFSVLNRLIKNLDYVE